jgi:hypothetical protein
MMADTELRDALASSLAGEGSSARERIARVESLLQPREAPAPTAPPHEKVVRDGFSMPAADYALIAEIQEKLMDGRVSASKSEVVRAGLHALKRLNPEALLEIVASLEKVKTGRPNLK